MSTNRYGVITIGVLGIALHSAVVLAHDPKEHDASSAAPDCAALESGDTSQKQSDDPVTQALNKKCHAAADHQDADQGAEHDHHAHDE